MDQPRAVASAPDAARPAGSLWEVARLFLKLGATAFGGPAAHIAVMENEVVRRRHWLSREEFLDLLGATNLIPGPNSTEMAIHIGHRRAGWPGLLVAGASFILPAAAIVLALAVLYVHLRSAPSAGGALYGVKPVIIAVVVQAIWGLGRAAVKTPFLAAVGLLAVTMSGRGANEIAVLLGAGVLVVVRWAVGRRGRVGGALLLAPMASLANVIIGVSATPAVPFGLGPLFLFFLKVGAVLFGSGYVLLAFLRADLVERWRWMSEGQLLDAIAVGQLTPGPVLATATFVGYVLGGVAGAITATVGIFLPAFVFVAISGPLIPRLRRSAAAGAFLDGVNVAALALMAVVTWQLGRAAIIDLPTASLAIASALVLLRVRLNSAWLVLSGAAVGWIISLCNGW